MVYGFGTKTYTAKENRAFIKKSIRLLDKARLKHIKAGTFTGGIKDYYEENIKQLTRKGGI